MALVRPAQATEGFKTNYPSVLKNAWENTFAVSVLLPNQTHANLGSVFVAQKFKKNGQFYLVLLTAAHVIKDISQIQKENTGSNVEIIRNLIWNYATHEKLMTLKIEMNLINQDFNKTKDIGAFLITVDKIVFDQFNVINLAPNTCAQQKNIGVPIKSYIVGFPGVFLRKNCRFVDDSCDLVTKRYSAGYQSIGHSSDESNFDLDLYQSTSDSLPGDSGGPEIDENGDLVGVNVGGFSSEDNSYLGDDTPDDFFKLSKKGHSFFVGCENISLYLDELRTKFKF